MGSDWKRGLVKDRSPEYMENLLQKALLSMREVVILDETGRMVYISEDYAENMGVCIEDALGKHITEVIKDSVLPSVLKSGQPIAGAIYCRNGKTMLVNRMPIKDNGKVIGVFAESIMTSNLESGELRKKLGYLTRELNYYKGKYECMAVSRFSIDSIVSRSRIMEDLKDTLRTVAETRSTVLLTGESGTGKEVFAGAIHSLSARSDKPFIRLNCAAIPDNLLESELFGYEEGAFTGAVKGGKIGDFEAADGGTLFLDEVDSLSPNMQAKLLRVIQEREVKKVGGTKPIPIDVRFIFATNKDLYQMMQSGAFREDFYYRINVINLRLPALRNRRDDIEPLVESFIRKLNREMDREIVGLDPEALSILESYDWPGNIRELENCIERAFIYCRGDRIGPDDIELFGVKGAGSTSQKPASISSLKEVRSRAERAAIQQALEACGGNKTEAAERLGVDRSILYDKIKKFGL